jgi:plastocyanin
MNRHLFAALSVALSSMAISGTASADTIVQSERAFHPAEITIAHGATLDFSNQDEFIHQIYVDSPNFSYDSEEQEPGAAPMHIAFPTAGTFAVRCHIHPKMLLTVHVK